MTKKLRERAKISVAVGYRVERVLILYVVRTRFIRRIHYRLPDTAPDTRSGVVNLADEGISWTRGWEGPEVEALAVSVALR